MFKLYLFYFRVKKCVFFFSCSLRFLPFLNIKKKSFALVF